MSDLAYNMTRKWKTRSFHIIESLFQKIFLKAAINKINTVRITWLLELSQTQQHKEDGRYHDGEITG
jgi:hypothetical protein